MNIHSIIDHIIWKYHGIVPFTLVPILFFILRKNTKSQGRLLSSPPLSPLSSSLSPSSTAVASTTQSKITSLPSTAAEKKKVTILYSTTTGTARKLSEELLEKIQHISNLEIRIIDLKDYDTDNIENEQFIFFICSTWTDGTLALSSQSFLIWLEDLANDFRISKMFLGKVKYAVFGLGGKIYGENFCKSSRELDRHMTTLGATSLLNPAFGDDASDILISFQSWSIQVETKLKSIGNNNSQIISEDCCQQIEVNCGCTSTSSKRTDGVKRLRGTKRTKKSKTERAAAAVAAAAAAYSKTNTNPNATNTTSTTLASPSFTPSNSNTTACCVVPHDDPDDDEVEEEDLINDTFVVDSDEDADADADGDANDQNEGGCGTSDHGAEDDGLVDLEDIGPAMAASNPPVELNKVSEREMVTKLQRKALTKEGYKIIGTHSAVKMCRWTKNQMRGRGGCYKHSFYGITSYQCMEATPSLACANKCVFCWRHHKNPVGTEWRWKTDPPAMIVDQAIEEHRAMVNQMKGVPGVVPERYQEAFTVRHCALSLVGEPIMYPHINEMLRLLHSRKISSFMVTNAQFPEAIRVLEPVTQLYVSVDAATKESLKAVDRPLFKDFWERFRQSLLYMKDKQQRTVYRMTLVKSYNMDEVEQYCDLIQEGEPDFIEIKAVTYCGKSDASSLTMKNVPWHHEVCAYAEDIISTLNSRPNCTIKYGIATEHEHSCCILIAREDRFKVNDQWHTWIDYPKFDELIQEYYDSNGEKTFTSSDYLAPTPEWALYKSSERGFDPKESRYRRTKTGAVVEVEYKSSESGCG